MKINRRGLLHTGLLFLSVACSKPKSQPEPSRTPEPPLSIAVAANFADVAEQLTRTFQERTGHTIQVSSGSSGKLYAQIQNGAPFVAFFSADTDRPSALEREGRSVAGTRFTYARGRLALVGASGEPFKALEHDPAPSSAVLTQIIEQVLGSEGKLAIADPALAPYGKAARELLDKLGLWAKLEPRTVIAESITQAYQFVASGNAALGFVAWSQVVQARRPPGNSARPSLLLAGTWHAPIEQQVVLLKENAVARQFLDFLHSDAGSRLVRDAGYEVP
jgi:molybdate transport system substrate-binding protein